MILADYLSSYRNKDLEVLDPQIRIPDQSDFEIPPPLQDIVDPK